MIHIFARILEMAYVSRIVVSHVFCCFQMQSEPSSQSPASSSSDVKDRSKSQDVFKDKTVQSLLRDSSKSAILELDDLEEVNDLDVQVLSHITTDCCSNMCAAFSLELYLHM
jgi:hypothetical protein